jgi:hypothetical protein
LREREPVDDGCSQFVISIQDIIFGGRRVVVHYCREQHGAMPYSADTAHKGDGHGDGLSGGGEGLNAACDHSGQRARACSNRATTDSVQSPIGSVDDADDGCYSQSGVVLQSPLARSLVSQIPSVIARLLPLPHPASVKHRLARAHRQPRSDRGDVQPL